MGKINRSHPRCGSLDHKWEKDWVKAFSRLVSAIKLLFTGVDGEEAYFDRQLLEPGGSRSTGVCSVPQPPLNKSKPSGRCLDLEERIELCKNLMHPTISAASFAAQGEGIVYHTHTMKIYTYFDLATRLTIAKSQNIILTKFFLISIIHAIIERFQKMLFLINDFAIIRKLFSSWGEYWWKIIGCWGWRLCPEVGPVCSSMWSRKRKKLWLALRVVLSKLPII